MWAEPPLVLDPALPRTHRSPRPLCGRRGGCLVCACAAASAVWASGRLVLGPAGMCSFPCVPEPLPHRGCSFSADSVLSSARKLFGWGLVLAAHFVPMTTCLQWGTQPGDCMSGLSAGGSAAHVFFIRFYSCRVSGDLVPATSYADTRIPSLYSPPLCPQCFSFLIFPEV